MAKETVEQTVEVTTFDTEEYELVFCDGCTHETSNDYVTLSNASEDCIRHLVRAASEYEVEHVIDERFETYHFCPECQEAIRSNGSLVSLAVGGGEVEPDDSPSIEISARTVRYVRLVAGVVFMFMVPAFLAYHGLAILSLTALLAAVVCWKIGYPF